MLVRLVANGVFVQTTLDGYQLTVQMACRSSPQRWQANNVFSIPLVDNCVASNRYFTRLSPHRKCTAHTQTSTRAITLLTIQFFHSGTTWLYHTLSQYPGFAAVKESYMSPEHMKTDEERRLTYSHLFGSELCACASHGYLDQVHGGRDRARSSCLDKLSTARCPVGVGTGLMGDFMNINNISYVFGSIPNLIVLVHVRTNYLRWAMRNRDPEKMVKDALIWNRINEDHMRWGLRIAASLPNAKLLLSTYEDMERNMTIMMHNFWSVIGVREPERRVITIPKKNRKRRITQPILSAIKQYGGAYTPCLYEWAKL